MDNGDCTTYGKLPLVPMRARTLIVLFLFGTIFVFTPRAAVAAGHLYSINSSGGECYAIGSWDSDTQTCTLTNDVAGSIDIDSPFITLDGAGHALTVDESLFNSGVHVSNQNTVTIKDLTMQGGSIGIYFDRADNGKAIDDVFASVDTAIVFFNVS